MTDAKKTAKRDLLRQIESDMQARWDQAKIFEANAPADLSTPKFMATFPYPYMNGLLHLGHSFSLTKAEFAIGYERLQGKMTLFPFGFHCTGMPIKACADKLCREVEMFGQNFERYDPNELKDVEENPKVESSADSKPIKKHGKAAAKKGKEKYQFQILQSLKIPTEEIHKFTDPKYWLYYFPPLAIQDLKKFGLHADWRRSFITTDINPYYDSFIRWQFNKLRSISPPKIDFGERYTIYSPLDGQACMDHDRSVGEGVGVQEYTGIKLEVLLNEILNQPLDQRDRIKEKAVGQELTEKAFLEKLGKRKLYLIAATLRPETMYGQTNCFVGVDLEYGIYAVNDSETWVCTERSAKNMAYQGLFEGKKGEVKKIADIFGIDLIGLPLKAPLASFERVFTLPMEGVLATKGTGVVTSVPSDSPDDYITLMDLMKKPDYYNIQKKWVEPFLPPKAIIDTPNYGNLSAVKAVEDLKIRSQKDKILLAQAKESVYKEGFYNGKMLVGHFTGEPVQKAKPLVKEKLVSEKLGFVYCEPEGLVISRSGDECVVTLADQWYMNYGEETWKEQAKRCLDQLETFSEDTKNAFVKTLDWLSQWACSRSFGLGSRLPWDPQYLIESLSDSTIYMAYYTIAHFLQEGSLDGSKVGPAGIKASEMTDAVWDYIFLSGDFPQRTEIPKEKLDRMRKEFEFFYPLDLRVSGKDLITNHLTFFLYNHVAIFPEKKWPKAIRANGHLLLNSEKMSKSTGNFLTLHDSIDLYGADATRFALADAGDSLEDANFLEETANSAILRLYSEREWILEVVQEIEQNKLRTGELSWMDRAFESQIIHLVYETKAAYSKMLYRDALKIGFFDLQNSRNEYRKATTGQGTNLVYLAGEIYEGMHRDVILKFIEVQTLLISPICPHWADSVWSDVLKKDHSVLNARWPQFVQKPDTALLASLAYLTEVTSKIRATEDAAQRKKAKRGEVVSSSNSKLLKLYVARAYPEWQEKAVSILKDTFDEVRKEFSNTEAQMLGKSGMLKDKRVMPFVSLLKRKVQEQGVSAFERQLPFNELETLDENIHYLRRELAMLKVKEVQIIDVASEAGAHKLDVTVPGLPSYDLVELAE